MISIGWPQAQHYDSGNELYVLKWVHCRCKEQITRCFCVFPSVNLIISFIENIRIANMYAILSITISNPNTKRNAFLYYFLLSSRIKYCCSIQSEHIIIKQSLTIIISKYLLYIRIELSHIYYVCPMLTISLSNPISWYTFITFKRCVYSFICLSLSKRLSFSVVSCCFFFFLSFFFDQPSHT